MSGYMPMGELPNFPIAGGKGSTMPMSVIARVTISSNKLTLKNIFPYAVIGTVTGDMFTASIPSGYFSDMKKNPYIISVSESRKMYYKTEAPLPPKLLGKIVPPPSIPKAVISQPRPPQPLSKPILKEKPQPYVPTPNPSLPPTSVASVRDAVAEKSKGITETVVSYGKVAAIALAVGVVVYLAFKTRDGYRSAKSKLSELAKYRLKLTKEEK
jgi:hypothetical protein